MIPSLKKLQKTIGYTFRDEKLLLTALSHSSYTNEKKRQKWECNERLEFLGDAVLELVSSEFLFDSFPTRPEGELTKIRASLVCEVTLAFDARAISLGEYLLLGKGEDATGGRERDSILSDALEALIGAIFRDGGVEPVKTFIHRFVLNDREKKQMFRDSKTMLQELLQSQSASEISYEIVGETGPDHAKEFHARVAFEGKILGEGTGRSKKAAEQTAAYEALLKIQK